MQCRAKLPDILWLKCVLFNLSQHALVGAAAPRKIRKIRKIDCKQGPIGSISNLGGTTLQGNFLIKLKGRFLNIKRALLCLLQNFGGGLCPSAAGSYVSDCNSMHSLSCPSITSSLPFKESGWFSTKGRQIQGSCNFSARMNNRKQNIFFSFWTSYRKYMHINLCIFHLHKIFKINCQDNNPVHINLS